MIDRDGHIKFIDFGFAKIMTKRDKTATVCGSPGYTAPEILNGTPYSYPVDIWSIGILICEMFGGTTPFYDSDPTVMYENIM